MGPRKAAKTKTNSISNGSGSGTTVDATSEEIDTTAMVVDQIDISNYTKNDNNNEDDDDKSRSLKKRIKIDENETKLDIDVVNNNNNNNVNNYDNTVKSEDITLRRKCPYLDTVNRQLLDFDQLKICSVTLTDMNVYSCLVCGKFFQGRSKDSPAYTHSVQCGHFVFINLVDFRAFCLPDGYEIIDQSLDDVKRCLNPVFNSEDIKNLHRNSSLARDVHGISYLPGFVGLNNLKHTDYANSILHALSHVEPLRNFFLIPNNYSSSRSKIVHLFGNVIRKLWSKDNFKSVISPVEFLEEVSIASKKKFDIGQPSDSIEFLVWLLGELHRALGGSNKKKTIISECFQGFVDIINIKKSENTDEVEEVVNQNQFMFLPLDIPPTPLFRDSTGGMIIPQIPLFEILKKFDGQKITESIDNKGLPKRDKFRVKTLPQFLILHLIRFTRNNFTVEKNVSIVTFPVKNLELKDYINRTDEISAHISYIEKLDLTNMSIDELKKFIDRYGSEELRESVRSVLEKHDLIDIAEAVRNKELNLFSSKYDLIANICHDSQVSQQLAISNVNNITDKKKKQNQKVTDGSYRVHIKSTSSGQWFEIEDLHVKETMPQLIGLSESYILIYQRKEK